MKEVYDEGAILQKIIDLKMQRTGLQKEIQALFNMISKHNREQNSLDAMKDDSFFREDDR
jgi:hypothetical protein